MSEESLTPETPVPDASVEAEKAPAASNDQEVVQAVSSAPAASEAQPAAEAAPASDVDPLTVLAADLQRVSAEKDSLQANHDRMYQEVNTLQRDLDAARAELAEERATRSPLAYQQQITDLNQKLAAAETENTSLKQQLASPAPVAAPSVVHLTEEALGKIKDKFLEALHEHAVAQVAPEAQSEPEAPAPSPFINRQ